MLERELMKLLEEAKKIRQQSVENESSSYYDDVFYNLSKFPAFAAGYRYTCT